MSLLCHFKIILIILQYFNIISQLKSYFWLETSKLISYFEKLYLMLRMTSLSVFLPSLQSSLILFRFTVAISRFLIKVLPSLLIFTLKKKVLNILIVNFLHTYFSILFYLNIIFLFFDAHKEISRLFYKWNFNSTIILIYFDTSFIKLGIFRRFYFKSHDQI